MSKFLMEELEKAFSGGGGALFVGAGASAAAGYPDWKTLIGSFNRLLDPPLEIDRGLSASDLLSIPQYFQNQSPDKKVAVPEKLRQFLKPVSPSAYNVKEAICRIPTNLIYTTNFDNLIEEELEKTKRKYKVLRSDLDVAAYRENLDEICVRKLHGCLNESDTIVFTREDFATFIRDRPNTIDDLKVHLRTRIFLFIGYSLSDPDFNSIYDQIIYQKHNQGRIKHYICLDSANKHSMLDLKTRGLHPIELAAWGEGKSERLYKFLNELADRTTTRHWVEKFYSTTTCERRLFRENNKRMPIVVSSKIIDEDCFSLPAVDTYTAQEIGRSLRMCNVEHEIIPADHVLQDESRSVMRGDVVLVCGPGAGGNAITREFFELVGSSHLGSKHFGVTFNFTDGEPPDSLVRGDQIYTSSVLPSKAETHKQFELKQEFGLVAKYLNPWMTTEERGYVYLFAGIRAIGTHFLGSFLEQVGSYRQLLDGSSPEKPFECVVKFNYDLYNPSAFKWCFNTHPQVIWPCHNLL